MTHISMTHPCLEELGVKWKRGGYQHRILFVLVHSDAGESAISLRNKAGLSGETHATTRGGLNQLRALGLVLNVPGSDVWKATNKGVEIIMEIGSPPAGTVVKPRTVKQKRTELYERPNYDGAELGKTCMRPGAYDAYVLPSIIGGKSVAPTWRNL